MQFADSDDQYGWLVGQGAGVQPPTNPSPQCASLKGTLRRGQGPPGLSHQAGDPKRLFARRERGDQTIRRSVCAIHTVRSPCRQVLVCLIAAVHGTVRQGRTHIRAHAHTHLRKGSGVPDSSLRLAKSGVESEPEGRGLSAAARTRARMRVRTEYMRRPPNIEVIGRRPPSVCGRTRPGKMSPHKPPRRHVTAAKTVALVGQNGSQAPPVRPQRTESSLSTEGTHSRGGY